MKTTYILLLAAALVGFPLLSSGQDSAQKPLTNSDVVKLVQGGLPESVIVSAIQSSATKFDLAPDALLRLQKAGVTKNELQAMITAGKGPSSGATPAAAVPSASPAQPRLPTVALVQNGSSQDLPIERTQLIQTKTKPTSMSSLAADSTLGQAMQAGVNTVSTGINSHVHSLAGNTAVTQATGVLGGFISHRKPTMTFVWAIPNAASASTSPVSMPALAIDFSGVAGTNADEFTPLVVKLTPSQNSFRLVGATEGKQDATSDPAADWQVYSHFVEDQVPVRAEKLAAGKYRVTPAAPLLPGDYGVVLRPVAKTKKFAGGDVARDQGDGMLFDSVWSFQVPADAKAQ